MLTVERISRSFDGFLALNQVSFEVERGEILGLIGPNGSGKSTLFNVASGALRPDRGTIAFEGRPITCLSPNRICQMGLVRTFQIPRPFEKLSILDNVRLAAHYGQRITPSAGRAEQQARAALEMVGLPTDGGARTDGLGAAGLKKLELAKALATQPRLLLADEILGGLDQAEMDQGAELLRRIRAELGVTIIWVEHIMGVLMRMVDRLIVLDHGQKIFEGRPVDAARDPRVIDIYLGQSTARHAE